MKEVDKNYVQIPAIINLGKETAELILKGFSCETGEEKINSIQEILNYDKLSVEAKIKFITMISTKPKKERFKIARSLTVALKGE